MKTSVIALFAIVCFAIAGCSTPMGLIYAHKNTLGIDLSSGKDATSPLQINVGTSNTMATYVPVGIPNGNIVVSASAPIPNDVAAALIKDIQQNPEKFRSLADIYSVYATFESRAQAGDGKVTGSLGNVFATGFAARDIANTEKLRICAQLEALHKAEADANVKTSLAATLKSLCH